MKKNIFRVIVIAVCAGFIFSLASGDAVARSKGFGGFGSSGSFSSGKSSSKSSFNWKKSNRKTGLSSVKRKSSAGKMSSADRALYNRAKTSGTVFKSRSDALKTFKGKHASKYPAQFSSRPAVRPDYIRPNISVKGKKYKVFYRKGGYGYYIGPLWYLYSPFDDDFEADELMAENDYYYGSKPGLSFMAVLGIGITLFLLMNMLKSFATKGKRQIIPFK